MSSGVIYSFWRPSGKEESAKLVLQMVRYAFFLSSASFKVRINQRFRNSIVNTKTIMMIINFTKQTKIISCLLWKSRSPTQFVCKFRKKSNFHNNIWTLQFAGLIKFLIWYVLRLEINNNKFVALLSYYVLFLYSLI